MEYLPQLVQPRSEPSKVRLSGFADFVKLLPHNILAFLHKIKIIGVTAEMSNYDKSKLGIFNHLNFFQFITGMIIPIIGLFHADKFPLTGWLMACLPALVSLVVLMLNSKKKYEAALLAYFIFYPVCICFSYINGLSLGVELSFILYGILSVFFIQDIGYMIFSICFSMVSYFILSVVLKTYTYQLENINFGVYLINQALAIIYIFYGLYLIKTENAAYNTALQQTNLEMQRQSQQLQLQAQELDQLNSLQNKLFSVISHDLKAPMYGLRNLFENMQQQDMPADEIKALIPDIKNDLNYGVSLMENLLQWAKSQMQSHTVRPQEVNINELIEEVLHVLHLQAKAKAIHIENKATGDVFAWVDRDMINLVLRNLISNAIKFTPQGGHISIGTGELSSFAEVFVQDSGAGISQAQMEKINGQEFYSTNGTAQEQGTGLGLMLCKEFLVKNGGKLRIESEPGKGSTFSFTLPLS